MKYLIILLILSTIMISCDERHVLSDVKELNDARWAINDIAAFTIHPPDTVSTFNMFLNMRNTDSYEFNNLYLISQIKFPQGKIVTDTLEYMMTDPEGRFLGTGTRDVYENKLWLKEGIRFRESGNYNLTLRHVMRKNGEVNGVQELNGVLDIGYSIEKQISENGND